MSCKEDSLRENQFCFNQYPDIGPDSVFKFMQCKPTETSSRKCALIKLKVLLC